MNTALVFATIVGLLVCTAFADQHVEKKEADKLFLTKQISILKLVHKLHQENVYKDQVDVGNSYDIEAHIGSYKNPKVVKEFMYLYKKGMVKKWQPFSVYYKLHLKQTISLFELFYYANDFDIFYKTACWARDRVNPLMFWLALGPAVLHRQDMTDIMLPPPYEIYPYFFVDSSVIQKAYKYWMTHIGTPEQQHTHIIPMNYTMKNKESLLYYFTEDVGLNTFNMYYRMIYPSWFNVTEYGHKIDRQGELFLYVLHQVYVRYSIERWSMGMPDVEPFVYNKPLKTAYNPKMMYHSGQAMPPRPSGILVQNFDLYTIDEIKNYERRVMSAIDLGYVKDEHLKVHPMYQDETGINYLGQMIEGSYNSPNYHYYGSLFHTYRMMLGHIMDPLHKYALAPTVLEHPQTTLRDPVNYQLYKRIYNIVKKFKDRLPSYTREELSFQGLRVENVEVSKMYTFMETFEFSLANAIYVPKEEDVFGVNVHVRQQRLNHKPFTYKIEVSSDKAVDAYVRVFLLPKTNYLGVEWDINERRHYVVELDRFIYHVKAGKTVIERNSQDSSVISPTPDSYRTFYKKVLDAIDGKTKYYIDKGINYCGFPENLLLPKGQKGGEAFTFFVILTPYVKMGDNDFEPHDHKAFSYCGVGLDHKYPDDKPLGFPFDRQILSKDFFTTNMFLKDVYIFHKKLDETYTTTH